MLPKDSQPRVVPIYSHLWHLSLPAGLSASSLTLALLMELFLWVPHRQGHSWSFGLSHYLYLIQHREPTPGPALSPASFRKSLEQGLACKGPPKRQEQRKEPGSEGREIAVPVPTLQPPPWVVFMSHFLFEPLFFHLHNGGPNSCTPGLLGSTHMLMEVGSLKECFGLRTWNLTFCAWLSSMAVEDTHNMQELQSQLLSLSCFHGVEAKITNSLQFTDSLLFFVRKITPPVSNPHCLEILCA